MRAVAWFVLDLLPDINPLLLIWWAAIWLIALVIALVWRSHASLVRCGGKMLPVMAGGAYVLWILYYALEPVGPYPEIAGHLALCVVVPFLPAAAIIYVAGLVKRRRAASKSPSCQAAQPRHAGTRSDRFWRWVWILTPLVWIAILLAIMAQDVYDHY